MKSNRSNVSPSHGTGETLNRGRFSARGAVATTARIDVHSGATHAEVRIDTGDAAAHRLRQAPRVHCGTALSVTFALVFLAAATGAPANAQSAAASEARVESGDAVPHGKLIGAKPTKYPDWFKHSFLDLQEDVEEARDAGRRPILFFHQDGCPYCNALIEQVIALDDVEREVRAHFDVIEMNMWGDREVLTIDGQTFTEKTFAAAMKVQFTPTLVFLGEQGAPVLRLNGYVPAGKFRTAIDYVKDGHYQGATFREFAGSAKQSPGGGAMTAQPFFMQPPYILTRGSGSKPLAVFFERPGCAQCEALHRGPVKADETRALLARFDVVQLDAWADTPVMTPDSRRTTAREWAEHLGVAYEPTIVYFDSMGTEVIRSEAFFKTFHVQSMMDYVLSGAWHEEPSFQRYISARADRFLAQGIDVDIWN